MRDCHILLLLLLLFLLSSSSMTVLAVTHVAEDGEVGDGFEDVEPDANILDPFSPGPATLAEVLVGVQADLHHVVGEGEEGSQGEGRHEERHEAVLDHWCQAGEV